MRAPSASLSAVCGLLLLATACSGEAEPQLSERRVLAQCAAAAEGLGDVLERHPFDELVTDVVDPATTERAQDCEEGDGPAYCRMAVRSSHSLFDEQRTEASRAEALATLKMSVRRCLTRVQEIRRSRV